MLQKTTSIEQNSTFFQANQKKLEKKRTIINTLKYIEDFERGNYQAKGKVILNLYDRMRMKKNLNKNIFQNNIFLNGNKQLKRKKINKLILYIQEKELNQIR